MASGQNPGEIPVGNKKLVLLIPVIGVVFVIVVVALVVMYTDPLKGDANPKGPRPRREQPADMQHLYDGSLPGDDDPNLKDLGNGLKYRDLLLGDGADVPDGATAPSGPANPVTAYDSRRNLIWRAWFAVTPLNRYVAVSPAYAPSTRMLSTR